MAGKDGKDSTSGSGKANEPDLSPKKAIKSAAGAGVDAGLTASTGMPGVQAAQQAKEAADTASTAGDASKELGAGPSAKRSPKPGQPGGKQRLGDRATTKAKQAAGAGKFDRTEGLKGTIGRNSERASLAGRSLAGDAAAIGALTAEAINSRIGRTGIKVYLAIAISFLLLIALFVNGLFAAMSSPVASDAGEEQHAQEAAYATGVPSHEVQAAASLTEGTRVPWEVVSAIGYTAKDAPSGEGWAGLDSEAIEDAKEESERARGLPGGGFGEGLRQAPSEPGEPWFATGGEDGEPYIDQDLLDAVESGDETQVIKWIIFNLDKWQQGRDVRTLLLDSGAAADGIDYRYIDANDPESATEAQGVIDAWIPALKRLPLSGNPERAEQVFELARMWALGNTPNPCATVQNASYTAGAWANPIIAPITSPYGWRIHPIFGYRKLHDGADLGAPAGDVINATGSGTVIHAGPATGYGDNFVKIDHGDGVISKYGHMDSKSVTQGQQISAGQPVGTVGSQGYSTGPHLHFIIEVNGETTDPEAFLKSRGIELGKTPLTQITGGGAPGTATTGTAQPAVHTSTGTAPTSGVGANQVRVAQANIPARSNDYRGAVAASVADGPDFVSLNESGAQSLAAITPNGYSSYRDPAARDQAKSTAVLWRSDRWQKVASGRVLMVADGPQKWDAGRSATWVTLQSSDLGVTSFISVHHMINPAKYGPNQPLRQRLYAEGLGRVNDLIRTLSSQGPVFLAGDLNFQASDNYDWGPDAVLGQVGLKSNHAALGRIATHDGGGAIDYIYFPSGSATAERQWTKNIASDHKMLGADFTVTSNGATGTTVGATGQTLPDEWTGTGATGRIITLDKTQLGFAATAVQKGVEMGVSDDGLIIMLMVPFTEGGWRNYASTVYPETIGKEYPRGSIGSDHDSVGLWQQRPQSGWGTPMELLDPAYGASAFLGGPQGPNGGSPMGLLDHQGWEQMPKGVAAQDVQVSAFPDRYAEWEQAATELLAVVKGAAAPTADCVQPVAAITGGWKMASFNMLGCSHTGPSGDSKPNWPSCEERFPKALNYLNNSGASVVGLQEFQVKQYRMLRAQGGAVWDAYPQTDKDTENALIWRKDQWEFVTGEFMQIPYFNGRPKPMPLVQLRSVATGEKAWFMNIHNPADTHGSAVDIRSHDVQIEARKVQELMPQGLPIFVMGDFNDNDHHGHVAANEPYCVLTAAPLNMKHAFGVGSQNPCTEPKEAHIDHIFGSGNVTFTGTTKDGSLMDQQVTDHPVIMTTVAGPGSATGGPTAAIEYAMAQVGKDYVWGAAGPNAFDCSGLTMRAFEQVGVTLPHKASMQATMGSPVDRGSMQPGDLIFYGTPVWHVSMYIGVRNGVPTVVHAANPRSGVKVSPLSEMESDITAIRRMNSTPGTPA